MTKPIPYRLAYHKLKGEKISVFCANLHGRQVDVDTLIERFGPDFMITEDRDRFLAAFRCNICGARGHDLVLTPGDTPTVR